ncbi:MAG: hypothetical protein R3E77_05350 [Steroidobacteraceae bacterium]
MNQGLVVSGRRLGRATAIALLAATLIFVTTVLPAEFGRDPTGFGRLTGLTKLSLSAPVQPSAIPNDNTAMAVPLGGAAPLQEQAAAPRSEEFVIPLDFADELEFKVRMKAGATLLYSLQIEGARSPIDAYTDFHGDVPGAEPEQVIEYRQATGLTSNGALRAPMDGVHGWFLQNRGDDPITVRLRLTGFYDLIPAGEYGNERGIEPSR